MISDTETLTYSQNHVKISFGMTKENEITDEELKELIRKKEEENLAFKKLLEKVNRLWQEEKMKNIKK